MSKNSSLLEDFRHFAGLDLLRVTEKAAIATLPLVGRGDSNGADALAVHAMRQTLNQLPMRGEVVIGEGERDAAPMLYIGEKVGLGEGPAVDVALDPLEGTSLTAKAQANALTVVAFAPKGGLLNAPDVYMEKIATGLDVPEGTLDINAPADVNVMALAKAKGVAAKDITVCVLDRKRHATIVAALRKVGARIKFISDGDVAGIIHTTNPQSAIDLYMGTGGAPEGVLAAAALKCHGCGVMQTRLVLSNDAEVARAKKYGITEAARVYHLDDMVGGDALFVATGVTDGDLLQGVQQQKNGFSTHSLFMESWNKTSRRVTTFYPTAF